MFRLSIGMCEFSSKFYDHWQVGVYSKWNKIDYFKKRTLFKLHYEGFYSIMIVLAKHIELDSFILV